VPCDHKSQAGLVANRLKALIVQGNQVRVPFTGQETRGEARRGCLGNLDDFLDTEIGDSDPLAEVFGRVKKPCVYLTFIVANNPGKKG